MLEIAQEWENHPITLNYKKGVQDNIDYYREGLANIGTDFNERELARKLGVVQGLEALLTYTPPINEEGELTDD